MAFRIGNLRIGTALLALALGVSLAAAGCSSKKKPGQGGSDEAGIGGAFGDGAEGPGGRSARGLEEARRLGMRTVYFDYDAADLRDDAKEDLRNNYEILREHPSVKVEIQGNCDERGSNEYNFALGERRAKAARDYLVRLGVSEGRLSTVSFGEENPAVTGHSESAWAKNRRSDFAVLP
jgi:peptidoglycan-associated lipoprotein